MESGPTPTIIKKIEYSPEILQKLHTLNHSSGAEVTKKLVKRRMIGIKECCVCSGLPYYEVIIPLDNATKIERYCHSCFQKREEIDSKYIDPKKYFVLASK